ncbi:MAG: fimbrial protein FimV [Rhodoferax sp.]|nr:FimV/HubP family polar landmark protein [Rhodoferax sp.]MDD2880882.1 fimbrial protein FimV [Rhodoferax sp.]
MGLWGTSANALSLGRVNVQSSLGEPLRAEIEILDINAEEAATLNARVAPPDAFRAAGLDYNAAMSSLQATLQRRSNGHAYLKLSSERAINEPFVDMILEASWSTGRIVRDYTMLFDPPGLRNSATTAIAPAQAPAPQPVPAPARALPPPIRPEATPPRAPSPAAAVKPAPASKPQTQQPDTDKQQVSVKTGDTAGRIAANNKPANVSLDQMLVALLRSNPDAFIGDNVNRIKAGAVVTLPTETEATATSTTQASQIIFAQSQDFNAFRRKLASSAPTTQVTPTSRAVSGKLEAKVEDKKPSAATPDKLTLSKGAVTDKASEDQLAQARNAKETANRAAELAKNLQDLNKIAAASSAGAAASEPKPAQVTLPVPVAQPEAPAASATAAASASLAASAAVAASAAAVASAPVLAPASAPAKAASAAKPVEPVAAEEPGFVNTLMEDPLLPGGALGLVALLVGFGFYKARQRKKAQAQDSAFGESRLQPESFFGNSGGQNVDTNNSVTGSSMIYSPSQLEAVDDVDPVAEADVYLAYGRDLQAEEILKDALRTRPERLAIHQKLLEIYAKRRDAKAFEAIATLAFNLTNGMGQDWEQICEKGLTIDPDNALYLPGGQPFAEVGSTTRPAGLDSVLPDAQTDQKDQRTEPMPLTEGNTDLDLDLDFSLDEPDLPDLPEIESAAPNLTAPAATEPAPLTLPDDFAWTMPEPIEPVEPIETAEAEEPAAPESAHMQLDYTGLSDDTLNSNDDFDKTQVLNVPAAADKPAADSGLMEFDLGSLALDFSSTKPGEFVTPDDASSGLLPDLDEGPITLAGAFPEASGDPLETKLALAEEFKAIGDDDGARALIEEVIAEATGEMKAKAQLALKQL